MLHHNCRLHLITTKKNFSFFVCRKKHKQKKIITAVTLTLLTNVYLILYISLILIDWLLPVCYTYGIPQVLGPLRFTFQIPSQGHTVCYYSYYLFLPTPCVIIYESCSSTVNCSSYKTWKLIQETYVFTHVLKSVTNQKCWCWILPWSF